MSAEQLLWTGVLGTFVMCVVLFVHGLEFVTRKRRKQIQQCVYDDGTGRAFAANLSEPSPYIAAFVESFTATKLAWMKLNPAKTITNVAPIVIEIRGKPHLYGLLIEYEKA